MARFLPVWVGACFAPDLMAPDLTRGGLNAPDLIVPDPFRGEVSQAARPAVLLEIFCLNSKMILDPYRGGVLQSRTGIKTHWIT